MNKEEILIAIKDIQCRYSLPALERNFTDKDYACKQYEKLVIHLANQQEEKDKDIEKLRELLDYKNSEIERLNHLLEDIKIHLESYDYDNMPLDAKVLATNISLIIDGTIKVVRGEDNER